MPLRSPFYGKPRLSMGGARGAEPRLVGGGTGECSPPWGDTKGARSPPLKNFLRNPPPVAARLPLTQIRTTGGGRGWGAKGTPPVAFGDSPLSMTPSVTRRRDGAAGGGGRGVAGRVEWGRQNSGGQCPEEFSCPRGHASHPLPPPVRGMGEGGWLASTGGGSNF